MNITEATITALCLCADCFAVSVCSSTTLKGKTSGRLLLATALAFAVIQAGLLMAGWLAGSLALGVLERFAHIVGGVLLSYVGGSMIAEGIRGKSEALNLNGWKNIIIGGLATSIDALAIGGAKSMDGGGFMSILPLFTATFLITALCVTVGILFGKSIGGKAGKWAEIAGGSILAAMGIFMMSA